MPLPVENQSTPRLKLEFTPEVWLPVVAAEPVEESELSSLSSSSERSPSVKLPSRNPPREIPDSDDDQIKLESSDVDMLEVDEEPETLERMEVSDDDKSQTLEASSQTLGSSEGEASDREVMIADGVIKTETESQGSTELDYVDAHSEADNDSNYSDSSATLQAEPIIKSKPKAAKSKVAKSNSAKSKSKSARNNTKRNTALGSDYSFPAQNQHLKVQPPRFQYHNILSC